MFKELINATPFVSEEANSCFTNICHVGACGGIIDSSFITTLRVLLEERLPDEDVVKLSVLTAGIDGANLNEAFKMWSVSQGEIRVIRLSSAKERAEKDFNIIDDFFKIGTWTRVNKITEFYKKSFCVRCFIHHSTKKVLLIVDKLDAKVWHYLQCSIVAFLPWYFSDKTISEEEMSLIQSLGKKTADEYRLIVEKLAVKHDFRKRRIERLLDGFDKKRDEMIINQLNNDISDTEIVIERCQRKLAELFEDKRNYEISLLGATIKLKQNSGNETKDYFLCNKNLTLKSVFDNKIVFVVRGYLEFFDEEMAERAISNYGSYVYEPGGEDYSDVISDEDMKMLMSAIFIDQELKVKVCAAYNLTLGGRAAALSEFNYEDSECSGCMPNPHIDYYSCLGTYESLINQCLSETNIIGAIEQCVASCKSLNFGDITVMSRFMEALYNRIQVSRKINRRFIEAPDGTVMTPENAIKWLKERKE